MSRSISIPQARRLAEHHGLNAMEQRGFYSHFLRIRRGLTTLGTPSITGKRIGLRAVMKAIEAKPFFAVLNCWDMEEGIFPEVKVEGDRLPSEVLYRSPMNFATKEEAETWAYANDPDDGGSTDAWVMVDGDK